MQSGHTKLCDFRQVCGYVGKDVRDVIAMSKTLVILSNRIVAGDRFRLSSVISVSSYVGTNRKVHVNTCTAVRRQAYRN